MGVLRLGDLGGHDRTPSFAHLSTVQSSPTLAWTEHLLDNKPAQGSLSKLASKVLVSESVKLPLS
jgi:hypothetical protein